MPILAGHSQRQGYRSDIRLRQGFGLNPFISSQERRRNFSTQDFERQGFGTPALLVKTAARYTGAAIYKDEAFQARIALIFSPLNVLTKKSSPKLRKNQVLLQTRQRINSSKKKGAAH